MYIILYQYITYTSYTCVLLRLCLRIPRIRRVFVAATARKLYIIIRYFTTRVSTRNRGVRRLIPQRSREYRAWFKVFPWHRGTGRAMFSRLLTTAEQPMTHRGSLVDTYTAAWYRRIEHCTFVFILLWVCCTHTVPCRWNRALRLSAEWTRWVSPANLGRWSAGQTSYSVFPKTHTASLYTVILHTVYTASGGGHLASDGAKYCDIMRSGEDELLVSDDTLFPYKLHDDSVLGFQGLIRRESRYNNCARRWRVSIVVGNYPVCRRTLVVGTLTFVQAWTVTSSAMLIIFKSLNQIKL